MATSGICKPVFHWDSNKTHHSNTNEMYGKLLLLLGVMAAVFAEPHYPPPPPPHYPPPYPKPHVPVGPPHVTPHRPPHHVPHVPPHHVPHVPPHVPHVPPHTPHKPPHHVPHRHYIVPPYRYRRDVYDGVDAQEGYMMTEDEIFGNGDPLTPKSMDTLIGCSLRCSLRKEGKRRK